MNFEKNQKKLVKLYVIPKIFCIFALLKINVQK